MLRIDGYKHLHHMVFGQTVENDRWDRERLFRDVVDIAVKREQPGLSIHRSEDAPAFRHLRPPDQTSRFEWFERQLLVARDNDGARNRGQIPRLPALFVILDKLFNFAPDDVALVGLLARSNPPFEQI